MMNKDAFIAAVVSLWRDHDCMDIEGPDFQRLLIEHGLAAEAPATIADCETDWAKDNGLEPGDLMLRYDDDLLAMTRERTA